MNSNTNNTLIGNKYSLIEQIGKGQFGEIYKAENIRTHTFVAIKIEPIINETKLLKNETKIYQYLNTSFKKGIGIPNVLWFGLDNKNYYMAIDLLGISLQELREKHSSLSFSLNMISIISKQMIQRIQYIHTMKLIHRDIKPDNFLFGLKPSSNILFLIDYGLCKQYITNNGTHILNTTNKKIIGTPNFVSINIHNGSEPSRRDDLESVAYIMYYLWKGSLEWHKINNNNDIINLKLSLMRDKSTPLFITNFFNYCRTLTFEELPDYNNILNILNI